MERTFVHSLVASHTVHATMCDMKYFIPAVALSILVLPVFVSAQSTADVATQARTLLNQIVQLQQQLGVPGGATSASSGGVCYSGATVKPGSRGATVNALQQFLASDPSVYPEGNISGYYGALTQAAVKRWQSKNGIINSGSPSTTGYGSVGPKTAAAMAASCGGQGEASDDSIVGGFIKVSPINGNAPLSVNTETTINTVKSCSSGTYSLNWGDGLAPINISVPANTCDVLSHTYTHTYTANGTFDVTLSSGVHQNTTMVTVGGGVQSNGSATTDTNSSTGGSNTGGSAGTQTPGALAVSMGSSSFSPRTATISSGTKVTWTNTDSTSHTVSADNASYNSGTLAPGQSYSLVFTTKGEYNYYCAYHGGPGGTGMSGKLIVQ